MRLLEIDSSTTLAHILNELKNTTEDGLEITSVPNEETLLNNDLNRTIIEKVAKEFKKEVVLPAEPIDQAPESEGDELGFVEGEDILTKAPMEKVDELIKPASVPVATKAVNSKSSLNIPNKFLKNRLFLIGGIVLTLIIVLLTVLLVLPSAEIIITPNSSSKDTQITLAASSTQKEVNTKDKIIPYETSEVTKTGEDQLATTGKKSVGEPAKGRVTITNQDTNSEKTFAAGTILTPVSTTSMTYKLDNEVTLEKAPPGSNKSAGVNVTAVKPGPEGNLAEGSVFKVGSSDATFVFAKNDIAFTGGTIREAKVASAQDRETLKNKILEKINKEIQTELEKKVKGSLVVENSYETKIVKETYDPKAVDGEAETLKATIQVQTKANLVKEDNLKKILIESLSQSEKNTKVDEENLTVSASLTDREANGNLKLIGKAKANLFATLDESDIKRHVIGKSLKASANYLDSVKEISGYKVTLNPSFFRFIGFMPFFSNRIEVKTK